MGISVTKLLVVLAIILVIFGTKRLKNVGSDLGGAIRNFRQAIKDGENEAVDENDKDSIEGEVTSRKDE